jgi:hypothetical protein
MANDKEYPNRGRLFRNDRRNGNDRAPDLRGDFDIICPHCNKNVSGWVSAWKKTGASMKHWLSLAFTAKDGKAAASSEPKPSSPAPNEPKPSEDDDDLFG